MRKLPYFKFGSSAVCTYCGEPPDGLDHVICVASQTIMREVSDKTKYGPTTHCCKSCNTSILGAKSFDSFLERCAFVSKRIERDAKAVKWTQAQIAKLDYSLRMFVIQETNKRIHARTRADWFMSRPFLLNIQSLSFQACLDRAAHKFSTELFHYFASTVRIIKDDFSET